jgi:hypothetical protein
MGADSKVCLSPPGHLGAVEAMSGEPMARRRTDAIRCVPAAKEAVVAEVTEMMPAPQVHFLF